VALTEVEVVELEVELEEVELQAELEVAEVVEPFEELEEEAECLVWQWLLHLVVALVV
jgi:hypothetical protein